MSRTAPRLMPLAAALAALTGTAAVVAPASASVTEPQGLDQAKPTKATGIVPNKIVSTGADFMGFLVTKTASGTVVAWHASHASHYSSSR